MELGGVTVIDLAQEEFGITFGGLGILQPRNTSNKRIRQNDKASQSWQQLRRLVYDCGGWWFIVSHRLCQLPPSCATPNRSEEKQTAIRKPHYGEI